LKRFLTLAILTLFVMMPLASSAKVAISDSDLDAVIAEAGVSITFNNVTLTSATSLGVLSWGDADGFSSAASGGFAGLANISVTAGNAAVINGDMLVDVGTNAATGGTKVKISLPNIILGGVGSNVSAKLVTDTAKALNTSAFATNITVTNLAIAVGGSITVSAH
jgi:alanine racemase